MEVEIFTLCDFAKIYGGRMTMIGPFDTIYAHNVPVTHNSCHIAFRVRFELGEEGERAFRLNFISSDGDRLLPPLTGTIKVNIPTGHTFRTYDLAIGLNQINFPNFGEYSIRLTLLDKEVRDLPIKIVKPPDQSRTKEEPQGEAG